ncbi:MAG: hypothetical protein HPY65_03120 [Syntrophaceae bacterium]|nr:hypothetical protein [Syntrophaceae bacterium]
MQTKRVMVVQVALFLFFLSGFAVPPSASAEGKGNWAATVYGAVQTHSDLTGTFTNPDFDSAYHFVAFAVSRRMWSWTRHIDWELEGQAVKHFGDQNHMEFNALLIARWLTFPWDSYLDTSFAVGNGLSYATRTPRIEEIQHDKTSQLLDYMLFELTFSLPEQPRWSLVLRIHHRSGVYGLFNGVHGASNALGAGLKYHF